MRYPEPDAVINQGDTAPRLTATLIDADGAPIDATGATVVLELTGLTQTGNLVLPASVADDGSVYHDWAEADSATTGYYGGRWRATLTSGQVQSAPNDGWFILRVMP